MREEREVGGRSGGLGLAMMRRRRGMRWRRGVEWATEDQEARRRGGQQDEDEDEDGKG